jgi:BirA family transcriptional regulator, biotin operon repressor / biotin---[acetyl-CoA-carboxylase] ligase
MTEPSDRLSPEEVIPLLATRWMGRRIHYFPSLDSTHTAARRLALDGAAEGEIVIAEAQDRGRGRLGRPWFSPPFANLYLSVILRPPVPLRQASLVTLTAAVAAAEAVEAVSSLSPSIKWPNDLLLEGRKLAGLLNEVHAEGDRVGFLLLGIGVNLNIEAAAFPEDLRPVATSLREATGRPISRKTFVKALLEALERGYLLFSERGGEPVLAAWRKRAAIGGKRVRVVSFGETVEGEAVDVDEDGALLLRTGDGTVRRIIAGDLEQAP